MKSTTRKITAQAARGKYEIQRDIQLVTRLCGRSRSSTNDSLHRARKSRPDKPCIRNHKTGSLRARLFVPGDNQINTGRAWDDWIKEIEREFRYFRITDPLDKKDALITYGGKEIARLEKGLPDPTDYEKLKN